MAKRKLRILLVILIVIILCGLAWIALRPRGPTYRGKPLSAWLEQYIGSADGSQTEIEAEKAILQIGTNAIPQYVKWLEEKDTDFRDKAISLLRKQSLIAVPWYKANEHHTMARIGFGVLGSNAAPAVPSLIDLLEHDSNYALQGEVVMALGRIGPAAEDAVPALLKCLKSTNRFARLFVPHSLAAIQKKPELVVPALIQHLDDSKRFTMDLSRTIEALGDFGAKATSAVPAIIPFLNHQDVTVSSVATNALKQIDPEAAAKAGIK